MVVNVSGEGVSVGVFDQDVSVDAGADKIDEGVTIDAIVEGVKDAAKAVLLVGVDASV